MRRFPTILFLVLSLSLAEACGESSPTAAQVISQGEGVTPGPISSERIVGILQITDDNPVHYVVRLDDEQLVLLIWDAGAFANSLVGERVEARGKYREDGSFAVESLKRTNGKQLPY
jgi:hypothetical protein